MKVSETTMRGRKRKVVPRLPIDIPLPENITLPGGTLFVRLKTLSALEAFWSANRERFPFAAKGIRYGEKQRFLDEDEWVFGPTKSAVVSTAMRWDEIGIRCEWYDWAKLEPADYQNFFTDRAAYRSKMIRAGKWDADDEADYGKRTLENYRGWWALANLPGGMTYLDWFSPFGDTEIADPKLAPEVVTTMMQALTFDDWHGNEGDIEFADALDIDREIGYWREECGAGEDYYGQENE